MHYRTENSGIMLMGLSYTTNKSPDLVVALSLSSLYNAVFKSVNPWDLWFFLVHKSKTTTYGGLNMIFLC